MGSDRDDMHFERAGALGGDIAAHIEAIVGAAEREALVAERAIEDRRRSAEEEVRRYLAAARLHVDAEAAARAARLEALSGAARRLADELSDAAAALNQELRRSDDELRGALPRAPWPAPRDARSEPEPDRGRAPRGPDRFAPAPAPAPAPGDPARFDAAAPGDPRAAAADAPGTGVPAHEPPPAPQPTWARTAGAPPPPPPAQAQSTNGTGIAPEPSYAVTAPVPAAASGEVPNAARLVAIEMAVGGASRADVETHLHARFGVGDPAPLLDDVFGAESQASSRLAWGEP